CRANLLPRESTLSETVVESNFREDTVQIVYMHSRSETLTAALADCRVARCSRRLIELHAELSGTLKNMEKLPEREIEQRGDHRDRMQNREKTVELSTKRERFPRVLELRRYQVHETAALQTACASGKSEPETHRPTPHKFLDPSAVSGMRSSQRPAEKESERRGCIPRKAVGASTSATPIGA